MLLGSGELLGRQRGNDAGALFLVALPPEQARNVEAEHTVDPEMNEPHPTKGRDESESEGDNGHREQPLEVLTAPADHPPTAADGLGHLGPRNHDPASRAAGLSFA